MNGRDALHQLLDDLTDDEATEALEYLHWLVDTRDQADASEPATDQDAGDVLPSSLARSSLTHMCHCHDRQPLLPYMTEIELENVESGRI